MLMMILALIAGQSRSAPDVVGSAVSFSVTKTSKVATESLRRPDSPGRRFFD
jgi:hypothetical protein